MRGVPAHPPHLGLALDPKRIGTFRDGPPTIRSLIACAERVTPMLRVHCRFDVEAMVAIPALCPITTLILPSPYSNVRGVPQIPARPDNVVVPQKFWAALGSRHARMALRVRPEEAGHSPFGTFDNGGCTQGIIEAKRQLG